MSDVRRRLAEWADEWARMQPDRTNRRYWPADDADSQYDETEVVMASTPDADEVYWLGVQRILDDGVARSQP